MTIRYRSSNFAVFIAFHPYVPPLQRPKRKLNSGHSGCNTAAKCIDVSIIRRCGLRKTRILNRSAMSRPDHTHLDAFNKCKNKLDSSLQNGIYCYFRIQSKLTFFYHNKVLLKHKIALGCEVEDATWKTRRSSVIEGTDPDREDGKGSCFPIATPHANTSNQESERHRARLAIDSLQRSCSSTPTSTQRLFREIEENQQQMQASGTSVT